MLHTIQVRRTARYETLGPEHADVAEVWFVLHGYGQLVASFIRAFDPLDDGTRLIVAPEALNRFYLAPVDTPAAERPVGATWMTREDRLNEIDDYVAYLDAVAMEVVARLRGGRWPSRVVVLGFSQGTATAVRWVGRGTTRPTHLVLWGGFPPPEMLSREQSDGLHGVSLRVVVGSRDPFVSTDRLAEEERRLREAGLPYELIRYDGGHGIGGVTLRELARTFATPA